MLLLKNVPKKPAQFFALLSHYLDLWVMSGSSDYGTRPSGLACWYFSGLDQSRGPGDRAGVILICNKASLTLTTHEEECLAPVSPT